MSAAKVVSGAGLFQHQHKRRAVGRDTALSGLCVTYYERPHPVTAGGGGASSGYGTCIGGWVAHTGAEWY